MTPDAQGRGVGRFSPSNQWPPKSGTAAATQMYVMWEPGEDGPEGFYRKLWFQLTGEKRAGQTVGVLDLTHPS